MPRFSANLSTLFTELPLLDRIPAAAAAGFKAIEFQWPTDAAPEELAARARDHGLKTILINSLLGPRPGDRGLASIPGREADFRAGFERTMEYAQALGSANMQIVCDIVDGTHGRAAMIDTLAANLQCVAPIATQAGVTLLLEPLNPVDAPHYLLTDVQAAMAVIDRLDLPNLKLQFDFYHQQMSGGDLAGHARRLAGRYGHVQISNAPKRREPNLGEINYPYLFGLLDEIGYDGWIGCEYFPSVETVASLAWARPWGIGLPKG